MIQWATGYVSKMVETHVKYRSDFVHSFDNLMMIFGIKWLKNILRKDK